MKGPSSDSSSKTHAWVLPQSKKLFWQADGTTNLIEWKPDVIQAFKGAFPIYASCISTLVVPPEWTVEYVLPTQAEWDLKTDPERRKFDLNFTQYESVRQGWAHAKPAMCSFLLLNITESSDKRALEQGHAAWDLAKNTNAVTTLMETLCNSHNFFGAAASLKEQNVVRLKHDTFVWINPEDLPQFKLRWDKLIKEILRVGITIVMLPEKNRFLQFATALSQFGHSVMVKQRCILRVSTIETDPDYDIDPFYTELVALNRAENPELNGVPQLKDPTVLAARTITQQLKGEKGGGKKGNSKKGKGGGSGSSTSSETTKESTDSGANSNPNTKAYIERKAKETGKSAAEIRKNTKCNNCGKVGHIASDCK